MNATSAEAVVYNVFVSGGIPLTLAINCTIFITLVCTFILCVRRLPLYNVEMKKKLREELDSNEENEVILPAATTVGSQWVTIPIENSRLRENRIERLNNVDVRRASNSHNNNNCCLSSFEMVSHLFCCICCPQRESYKATKEVR